MNDLTAEVGLVKRQVRDVQSVVGNVQHLMRKLIDGRAAADDRPGGLVARHATCAVLGHVQRHGPDAVARNISRPIATLTDCCSSRPR